MSDDNNFDDVPEPEPEAGEAPSVLRVPPPPRPKTKDELEREIEEKARDQKNIYLRLVGKITKTEANLIIINESHGFCNALKKYLLKNDHVLFASYKKEFGVDPSMYVNTDGEIAALDALIEACDKLHVDLKELESVATQALSDFG
ncbi:MAG TPA: RpoL/Rpb11 RNA polymerase subunit family protein [Candidatus Lokiarchaeia archaeon]|nr:RpoL/Rpb11 RNA polymerase subunit family protein [Candidatus Lokiarchaeia archaeon]